MNEALVKYLELYKATDHYDVIVKKTGIVGKECWTDPTSVLEAIPAEEITERLVKSKVEVEDVYTSFATSNIHFKNEPKFDADTKIVKTLPGPSVRQGEIPTFLTLSFSAIDYITLQ